MCYTWDKRLIRSPCVTRGRGNLNVSHVLHVGNFAILSQNMYDPDKLGKGVDIYIGKTGDDICPVAAVLSFLAIRGMVPGPLFVCCDSTPCTKARFISKLRSALQAAGLVGPNFAGHSFRIGAATTPAERGIEDSTIKALGRWHSSAFLAYLRMPKEHLATISPTLSKTPPRDQA